MPRLTPTAPCGPTQPARYTPRAQTTAFASIGANVTRPARRPSISRAYLIIASKCFRDDSGSGIGPKGISHDTALPRHRLTAWDIGWEGANRIVMVYLPRPR